MTTTIESSTLIAFGHCCPYSCWKHASTPHNVPPSFNHIIASGCLNSFFFDLEIRDFKVLQMGEKRVTMGIHDLL